MIATIIPSLNEEKNIGNLVKVVDKGLDKYFSEYKSIIVNADNNSLDKTINIFKNTLLTAEKISIVNKKKGKGINIHSALKKIIKRADIFLMLDADVKSSEAVWVRKLLNPIVNDKYDLVIPIYTRNRFEGNTTNHFSSPVTFAVFGIDILQPIAGDFSFNKNFAVKLLKSFHIKSDFQYGVDALLVTLAVLNKFKIKQVKLGRKIHNPSFGKIYPIFTQEATSMFYLINKFRNLILKNKFKFYSNNKFKNYSVADGNYIKKPKEKEIIDMKKMSISQIKNYEKLYKTILDKDVFNKVRSGRYALNYFLWNSILSDYLKIFLTKKMNKEKIMIFSQSLFPFYMLRTATYFDEIISLKPKEIDALLLKQKKELRNSVKLKLKDELI